MLPIARPPNPNASVRQVSPAKTTKPDANAGSAHPVPLQPARRRLNGTKVKKSQCRWHVTGYAAGGQTKKMAFFRQTLTRHHLSLVVTFRSVTTTRLTLVYL